jgi:hypothetical protein
MNPQQELYRMAIKEDRLPMRPTDAARMVGISPKTVFRYLAEVKVWTPCGPVTFFKDSSGLVSLSRLKSIIELRKSAPPPGRRYGTTVKLVRNGKIRATTRLNQKKENDGWRIARILAGIDLLGSTDDIQQVIDYAKRRKHRI